MAKPNGNEIYELLMEKAWAKVNGGYMNIIRDYNSECYEISAGFGSQKYRFYKLDNDEMT